MLYKVRMNTNSSALGPPSPSQPHPTPPLPPDPQSPGEREAHKCLDPPSLVLASLELSSEWEALGSLGRPGGQEETVGSSAFAALGDTICSAASDKGQADCAWWADRWPRYQPAGHRPDEEVPACGAMARLSCSPPRAGAQFHASSAKISKRLCGGMRGCWGFSPSWERVHTQLAWEGAIFQELGDCWLRHLPGCVSSPVLSMAGGSKWRHLGAQSQACPQEP